jgi:hypothetical protein
MQATGQLDCRCRLQVVRYDVVPPSGHRGQGDIVVPSLDEILPTIHSAEVQFIVRCVCGDELERPTKGLYNEMLSQPVPQPRPGEQEQELAALTRLAETDAEARRLMLGDQEARSRGALSSFVGGGSQRAKAVRSTSSKEKVSATSDSSNADTTRPKTKTASDKDKTQGAPTKQTSKRKSSSQDPTQRKGKAPKSAEDEARIKAKSDDDEDSSEEEFVWQDPYK